MKGLPFVLFSLCFLLGCGRPEEKGIVGEGPMSEKDYDLKDFHYIEFGLNGDVFIRTGENYKVHIDAQNNILAAIETELHGDTLSIRFNKNVSASEKTKALIQLPTFMGLALSGSGNAIIEQANLDKSFVLAVNGSGNIESARPLKTEFLQATVSGSGNIRLKGNASRTEYELIGSGNIECDNLKADDVKATVSGSGNIRINALKTLHAIITGSGNIEYRGKPTLTQEITGSGHLRGH